MKLFIVVLYISILSLSACSSLSKNTPQPAIIHKQEVTQSVQPRSERSLYLGAQTAMRNGQPLLAIQFLKALLSQQNSSNKNNLKPKLQLADLLLKSNHPNQALQYLQKPIQHATINKENSPDPSSEATSTHIDSEECPNRKTSWIVKTVFLTICRPKVTVRQSRFGLNSQAV